jgi:polysaccharide pyruvyl transferase WcaK-like protein
MITDAQLDEALHYLLDEADRDAAAKAHADYLKEMLKVVKADLVCNKPGMSVASATVQAEASPEYREALNIWRIANEDHTKRTFLRAAKETLISVWQSERANQRARL